MDSSATASHATVNAPTDWQGECGLVGPFESRSVAQTFASFRVDFARFIVQRTFAKGNSWYLEIVPSQLDVRYNA